MAKAFSIFADDRNDHSKMVKQLLSDEVPPIPKNAKPHRPASGNHTAAAAKPVHSKHKQGKSNNQAAMREEISKTSREDLILEVQDLKKKLRHLEESHNHVKAENQRLESDATKQQRRIDQLLNLSDGAKNIGMSSEIRRDIEKSILVRQLKNQINNLRNDLAEKEAEFDQLKRNIKSTHMSELVNERDEYYLEVQRLKAALLEVKDELSRERQRREWNTRVAGDASEDLRKEVARLSSGYQSMLANISNRTGSGAQGQRPSTSTGMRAGLASAELTPLATNVRPVSATATSHHSPTREHPPERPTRPLSANSKSTPLSAYYQAEQVSATAVNPQTLPASSDPLDNFGVPTAELGSAIHQHGAVQEISSFLHNAAPVTDSFPPDDSGIFKIGDHVQGLFEGGDNWYTGKITKYNSQDGTYAVQYDDGDFEASVALEHLRVPPAAVDVIPVRAPPLGVPTLAAAPASHPALVNGGLGVSMGVGMNGSGGGMGMGYIPPMAKPKPVIPLSEAPYKVGEKVDALYYKGTTWYSGKIQSIHPAPTPGDGDFVFDIAYDDGDRELKVPFSNIRAKVAPAAVVKPAAASPLIVPATEPERELSQKKSEKSDLTDPDYGLEGSEPSLSNKKPSIDSSSHTPSPKPVEQTELTQSSNKRVDSSASSCPYKVGDRVQGYFDDMAAWYDGTIAAVQSSTTCYIQYDDGDEENDKHISKIKPLKEEANNSPKPTSVTSPSPKNSAVTDTKFSSTPAEPEKPVAAEPIAPTTVPAVPAVQVEPVASEFIESLFKVNDRVEGKFDDGDEWYPAVITAVHNPGLSAVYTLDYDDGDHEDMVKDTCIRLMALPPQPVNTLPIVSAVQETRTTPPPKRNSIVNTNLDSFLNDLSDDDDDSAAGAGGLDSGRGVTLQPASEGVNASNAAEPVPSGDNGVDEDDDYEEDFDA